MTDTLRIWSQVEKTDPAHTKKVNQRGGFTAISAAYQIKRATEIFGPVGEGWGYTAGDPIFHENMILVPVTLWHGDRSNVFGPMFGGTEWKDRNGRLDSDAAKKATTDALTKLLSQLGFNADVFLGRFDDSKYVAEMEREFGEPRHDAQSVTPPTLAERADTLTKFLNDAKDADTLERAWAKGSKLCADLDLSDPEKLAEITELYERRRDELDTTPFGKAA